MPDSVILPSPFLLLNSICASVTLFLPLACVSRFTPDSGRTPLARRCSPASLPPRWGWPGPTCRPWPLLRCSVLPGGGLERPLASASRLVESMKG